MFYLNKTPSLLKRLFPSFTWEKQNHKNNVFLTFDDGPTIEYTQQILDLLKTHGVLATFFCVGANVKKHSNLYKAILDDGHSVGNHTMHHLNGWKTSYHTYLANINEASNYVKSILFRPPYGKINFRSIRKINAKYKIIMWDVIGGDFDPKCSTENLINNVLNNVKAGAIVVLHDNKNFSEKTLDALPKIIEGIKKKGLTFGALK